MDKSRIATAAALAAAVILAAPMVAGKSFVIRGIAMTALVYFGLPIATQAGSSLK